MLHTILYLGMRQQFAPKTQVKGGTGWLRAATLMKPRSTARVATSVDKKAMQW